MYLSVYVPIHIFIYLYLAIDPLIYLSIYLST